SRAEPAAILRIAEERVGGLGELMRPRQPGRIGGDLEQLDGRPGETCVVLAERGDRRVTRTVPAEEALIAGAPERLADRPPGAKRDVAPLAATRTVDED